MHTQDDCAGWSFSPRSRVSRVHGATAVLVGGGVSMSALRRDRYAIAMRAPSMPIISPVAPWRDRAPRPRCTRPETAAPRSSQPARGGPGVGGGCGSPRSPSTLERAVVGRDDLVVDVLDGALQGRQDEQSVRGTSPCNSHAAMTMDSLDMSCWGEDLATGLTCEARSLASLRKSSLARGRAVHRPDGSVRSATLGSRHFSSTSRRDTGADANCAFSGTALRVRAFRSNHNIPAYREGESARNAIN